MAPLARNAQHVHLCRTGSVGTMLRSRFSAVRASSTIAQAVIPNHGVVAAGVVLSGLVHHGFMHLQVNAARKKYGVDAPNMYATKEICASEEDCYTFNCIQRGHQNSLELQPIFLAMFTVAALQHPAVAAACAVQYLIGRALYMLGYKAGGPARASNGGKISGPAFLALLITNMKIAGAWAAGMIA